MKKNQFEGPSQDTPENPESNQDQRLEAESRESIIERIKALEVMNEALAEKNKELAAENTRLKEIATKDPLTGAYNRRGFTEEINHIIPRNNQTTPKEVNGETR